MDDPDPEETPPTLDVEPVSPRPLTADQLDPFIQKIIR